MKLFRCIWLMKRPTRWCTCSMVSLYFDCRMSAISCTFFCPSMSSHVALPSSSRFALMYGERLFGIILCKKLFLNLGTRMLICPSSRYSDSNNCLGVRSSRLMSGSNFFFLLKNGIKEWNCKFNYSNIQFIFDINIIY